MAKRRLNKKLIIILLLVGFILALGMGVVVWLYRHRDPMPFLKEARVLVRESDELEAANEQKVADIKDAATRYEKLQALKKETVDKKRAEAIKAYGLAYTYSKNNPSLRHEVGMELADFRWRIHEYRDALGTWTVMLENNSKDFASRRKILNYYYEASKNEMNQWPQVKQAVDEMLASAKELKGDIGDKDPSYDGVIKPSDYLDKAHAMLAMLVSGTDTDERTSLETVQGLIDNALKIDPKNELAYYLLAQKEMYLATQADLAEERAKHLDQSKAYYLQLMEMEPDNPQVYEYYVQGILYSKINNIRAELIDVSQTATLELRQNGQVSKETEQRIKDKEDAFSAEIESAVKEVDGMIKRFENDGRFYVIKADLQKGLNNADYNALIGLYKKALSCPGAKVSWYTDLGNVYLLQNERTDSIENLPDAFSMIHQALYRPELKDLKGPEAKVRVGVRYQLSMLLMEFSSSLVEHSEKAEDKENYLSVMRQTYQELRDMTGKESIGGKIANGILAMAEGKNNEAIKLLYGADQQMKLSGKQSSPELKRRLFYLLRDMGYNSAAVQYGLDVIPSYRVSEEFILDLLNVIGKVPGRQPNQAILQLVNRYKRLFPDGRRQQDVLRYQAAALIKLGEFDQARKVVDRLTGDSDEIELLRAQAQPTAEARFEQLELYAQKHPDHSEVISRLAEYYLKKGKEDGSYYDRTRQVLQMGLKASPDDQGLQRLLAIANEPDPSNISSDRISEILLKQAKQIKDEFQRETALGQYYYSQVDMTHVGQWTEEDQTNLKQSHDHLSKALSLHPEDRNAFIRLFSVVINQNNWSEAEDLLQKWMKVDPVESLAFNADMKGARGDAEQAQGHPDSAKKYWQDASSQLEKLLVERPMLVSAYLTLAKLKVKLDLPQQAIENAKKALTIDQSNINAILLLAGILHRENVKTGLEELNRNDVSQMVMLTSRALELDPSNVQAHRLRVVYNPLWMAFILDSVRDGGLSADQQKQRTIQAQQVFDSTVQSCRYLISLDSSDIQNWQQLAELYYRYSQMVTDNGVRDELISQAEGIYKEALKSYPNSPELASAYGEFLQRIGQAGQARKLLEDIVSSSSGKEKEEATIRLGAMYFQDGDNKKAMDIFNSVLEKDPHNLRALIFVAEIYAKQKQLPEAIERYRQICELSDDQVRTGRYIELLMKANRIDEAEKVLASMKKKFPDSVMPLLVSGQVEYMKTNYAATVAYADQVLSKDAMNYSAYMLKSNALFMDRQYQRALDCLMEMRRLFPQDSDRVSMQLSDVYWAMGRYDDAISELQAKLHSDPKDIACRKKLSRRLDQQHRWDELEMLYRDSIEMYPDDADLYLAASNMAMERGDEYRNQHQDSQAKQQYDQAVFWMKKSWSMNQASGKPDLNILDSYLDVLLKTGKNEEAYALADKETSGTSPHPMLVYRKAQALHQMNREKEALSTYEQALNLVSKDQAKTEAILSKADTIGTADTMITWAKAKLKERPDWVAMRRVIASMYSRTGEYEKAIQELQTIRDQVDPSEVPHINYLISMTYEMMGNKDKASEYYRLVLEKQPNNATVMNNLAYNMLLKGDQLDQAVKLAKTAYELRPHDSDIMDTYALVLIKKEDYIQAEEVLRRAIQYKMDNDESVSPDYEYHLAQALLGQGRQPNAKKILEDLSRRLSEENQGGGNSQMLHDVQSLLKSLE